MSVRSVNVARGLVERRQVLRELEGLDPDQDARRMSEIVLGRLFHDAVLHQAMYTVGIWRQAAVGTIAPILARRGRGETLHAPQKRADDSLLLIGLMYRHGHSTPDGARTIGRLAQIHKSFPIPPDDYRYTIATFCYEPLRILEVLGIQGLTDREARAMYVFWTGVAQRWGIEIPGDQVSFRAWYHDYEQRAYRRTDDGVAVARATEKAFLDRWAPGPLRPVGAQVLRAMSDDHLLDTHGLSPARPGARWATALAVSAYLRTRRVVPGPVRDDLLIQPWSAEYGEHPDSSRVGPSWAADIQAKEPMAS
jgi:hypothetical protein